MKHWKTNEEMGSGYAHTKKEHQYLQYNSLIKVCKHEQNLMRTFYLIRDCWTLEQLEELKEFIDEQIKERKESLEDPDEQLGKQIYSGAFINKKVDTEK